MKHYIKFDAEGHQIASVASPNKPDGDDWVKAPKGFTNHKRYVHVSGKVKEVSEDVLALQKLTHSKHEMAIEVQHILNRYREEITGGTFMKGMSYTLQKTAAEHYLVAIKAESKPDDTSQFIIEELAHVRGIEPKAMAVLILSKAEESARTMAQIEVLEDEANLFLKQSTDGEALTAAFETWKLRVTEILEGDA